jgi:glycosyltransferase involved in cell wall biosynthesis
MTQTRISLNDVLVLSVRKGFWASRECDIFPNRIYPRRLVPIPGRLGSSRNPINNLSAALQGYAFYLRHKPRIIIIGSANRIAPWFANFKKWGWLPDVKLVASSQSYLTDNQVKWMECIIVYCSSEITTHALSLQPRYKFIPLPADGPVDIYRNSPTGDFIFSGGGAGRDFAALIEAVRGTNIPLEIVTFSLKTLNYQGQLPDNVKVTWRVPLHQFINLMASAKFVAIPLTPGSHPHGHTTVVQALSLGKAIISTSSASVDDYITQQKEGILVSPSNVLDYRQAILEMSENHLFRSQCEKYSREKIPQLSYQAYAERLAKLCQNLLST